MQTIKLFSLLFATILSFTATSAQTVKTETVIVSGNCNSCKKHIEKSALAAGATAANWDKNTRFLDISYDPATSNTLKIEAAIAEAGYDTQDFKASDSAYHQLEDCCQYDRKNLRSPEKSK